MLWLRGDLNYGEDIHLKILVRSCALDLCRSVAELAAAAHIALLGPVGLVAPIAPVGHTARVVDTLHKRQKPFD